MVEKRDGACVLRGPRGEAPWRRDHKKKVKGREKGGWKLVVGRLKKRKKCYTTDCRGGGGGGKVRAKGKTLKKRVVGRGKGSGARRKSCRKKKRTKEKHDFIRGGGGA